MSVRKKAMYLLADGKPHSKYEIRDSVLSWGRRYDQQSIDRVLQLLDGTILKSKKIGKVIYYKIV